MEAEYQAVWGSQQSTPVEVSASSDVELVENAKYVSMDDRDTVIVLPDEDSEIVVTRLNWSGDALGSFFLHAGDGVQVGPKIFFAANSGDSMGVHVKMGLGNPCRLKATISPGSGKLSVQVEYYIRRFSTKLHAAAYQDA